MWSKLGLFSSYARGRCDQIQAAQEINGLWGNFVGMAGYRKRSIVSLKAFLEQKFKLHDFSFLDQVDGYLSLDDQVKLPGRIREEVLLAVARHVIMKGLVQFTDPEPPVDRPSLRQKFVDAVGSSAPTNFQAHSGPMQTGKEKALSSSPVATSRIEARQEEPKPDYFGRAYAQQGCVVVESNERYCKYMRKCDRCNHVESHTRYELKNLQKGSRLESGFMCSKCMKPQAVVVGF